VYPKFFWITAGPAKTHASTAFQMLLVIAPIAYACLLTISSISTSRNRLALLQTIRIGTLYGLLFGVLAWGPSGGPAIINAVSSTWNDFFTMHEAAALRNIDVPAIQLIGLFVSEHFRRYALLFPFFLAYYSALGATAGILAHSSIAIWRSHCRRRNYCRTIDSTGARGRPIDEAKPLARAP
jgi:hypothetical protein